MTRDASIGATRSYRCQALVAIVVRRGRAPSKRAAVYANYDLDASIGATRSYRCQAVVKR